MSSESNQENGQHSEESRGPNNNENSKESNDEKKPLTFKDWKNLKDSQQKPNEKLEKSKNNKSKNVNKSNNNNKDRNGRNNFNNNNGFNGPNGQAGGNFYNRMPGLVPGNNYNGMNSYGSMNGNNYGFNKQNGYGFNNYYGPDNYNRSNNFGNNNFSNASFNNPRASSSFNGPNIDLPDNFFASDGIYRQKDLMQKPLPPSCNPFRDEEKAKQLLNEFERSRHSKDDKKKKNKNKTSNNQNKSKNQNQQNKTNTGTNVSTANNEPKVYVPNPKANEDGKPFIPKPKLPDQNLEISKDEKKQQWREYRQAMKPFKNREFYNAKRVVQRLGKKDPSELNEKELFRLANAREVMAAHKARLVAKYGTYVKADSESNEMGELYVLNKPPPPPPPASKTNNNYYAKPSPKEFQNYGNFGGETSYYNANRDHESGRKILGGYSSGYPGFVSGGLLEGTAARLYSQ